ncbi:hypothetical protein V2W45_1336473 [Cenococcum geophilum]
MGRPTATSEQTIREIKAILALLSNNDIPDLRKGTITTNFRTLNVFQTQADAFAKSLIFHGEVRNLAKPSLLRLAFSNELKVFFDNAVNSKNAEPPIPEFPGVSINSGPCRIVNLDEWNPEWHCIAGMCRLDDSAAFARYTTAVLCSPAKRPEIPSGFKTLDVLRVCRASSEWKPRWKTPNNPSGNNGAIAFCQCMQQRNRNRLRNAHY